MIPIRCLKTPTEERKYSGKKNAQLLELIAKNQIVTLLVQLFFESK